MYKIIQIEVCSYLKILTTWIKNKDKKNSKQADKSRKCHYTGKAILKVLQCRSFQFAADQVSVRAGSDMKEHHERSEDAAGMRLILGIYIKDKDKIFFLDNLGKFLYITQLKTS